MSQFASSTKDPGPPADRMLVVPWSDAAGMAPMRLQRTVALALPSPFPAANRRVVVDRSVTTLWRERAENCQPIADRLGSRAELDLVPQMIARGASYQRQLALVAEGATLPEVVASLAAELEDGLGA